MKKYNLSSIMKRAWEIKRENTKNIFSLCLKMAWAEAKEEKIVNIEEYLVEKKGLKVWEKGDKKRVYIDDLNLVGIERYTPNPKSFRKVSMYYDVIEDKFVVSGSTSSRKSTIEELINGIREDAKAC